MKVTKAYTIELTDKDYNDLLAVLAYCSGVVEYDEDAAQHSALKSNAKDLWYNLSRED